MAAARKSVRLAHNLAVTPSAFNTRTLVLALGLAGGAHVANGDATRGKAALLEALPLARALADAEPTALDLRRVVWFTMVGIMQSGGSAGLRRRKVLDYIEAARSAPGFNASDEGFLSIVRGLAAATTSS